MSYVWSKCAECGGINDIRFDGDNPAMCPDCQSVDCFETDEGDE